MGDGMEKYKGAVTEETFNPGKFSQTAGTNGPLINLFVCVCVDL